MPNKLTWTPEQDAKIKQLRAQGATWDTIAAALSVSRFTIIDRGRRVGAVRPPPPPLIQPLGDDPFRPPLPPGHPRTWKPLNQGTVLEGTAYPLPVFVG